MKNSVKVLSVTNPEGISVEEGTAFKKLELPEKVTVTVTGNLDQEVEVTWQKVITRQHRELTHWKEH